MDLYVKPLQGIRGITMDGDRMTVHVEAQGGLMVKLHMEETEWGWLAAILADKRAEASEGE